VEDLPLDGAGRGRSQAAVAREGLTSIPGEVDLDPDQRAVVEAPLGPAVVLAGAGSGKTRALVHRVAHLISLGVPPERIVLCTFTNRAARELQSRVEALVGSAARGVRCGTIHALAHRILDEHGGLGRFRILDRAAADALLSEALGDALPRAGVVRPLYARALAEERPLAEVVAARAPRLAAQVPALEAALDRYAHAKADAAAVDFDDLLLFCKILMLEKRPPLGVEHVLVDEFQDVTRLQAELLALLGGSLMVVGDPMQSIYGFRGADPRHLTETPPGANIYSLLVNYRSAPEILALANRTAGVQLRAARGPAERRPARVELDHDRQEARFVAARMAELIDAGRRPSELAALYRTHAHGVELELELGRRRVPYRVRAGARFAEQTHIRDVISFLELQRDPRDALAWSRVARQLPGVGARSAERIVEAGRALGLDAVEDRALHAALPPPAREGFFRLRALAPLLQPSERPERVLAAVVELHYAEAAARAFDDAEARLADLRALERLARASADTRALLDALALHATEEEAGEAVTLSTVHQAKGLEWSAVFLLSLVEGRFPLPAREPGDLDEERRLFYVAATRARDELYLCRPARDGETVLTPSRFLLALDGLYDRWSVLS
jgi:DNA helicase II / ATP-dependent DNA helicase PcrA